MRKRHIADPVLRRHTLVKQLKRIWPLYVLLLPAITYLLIFNYYPMYGAQIAFRDYAISKGITGSDWVGMKHFIKFVTNYQFSTLLTNTLSISLYSLLISFIVRTVLSLALNSMRLQWYKKTIQTVIYMPHFISTVVMVGILIRFFNPSMGVLSKLIQAMGGTSRDLMGVAKAIPHIYVWSGIWQNAGWSTILFLATLSSVDPELHEAAIIDGATRMKRIWHIDMPTLLPTMAICFIMDCGHIMNVGADKMLLMQNNLNLSTSQIISTYVYSQGIAAGSPKYSYATAIGMFNSLVNFMLIVIVNQISKKLNQSSLW
jgi:ABC-type polysaccharide transport system permease subunit